MDREGQYRVWVCARAPLSFGGHSLILLQLGRGASLDLERGVSSSSFVVLTQSVHRREMVSNEVLMPEVPKSLLGASETEAAEVHVLAVDDSVIDRRVIEKLLKTSAYKVTVVDSGTRALEILGVAETLGPVSLNLSPNSCSHSADINALKQAYEVNLIITDYCMPGMTGYDLLKKIKGTSALKEIPVVIMSSENVPNRISSCLAEGAEEFLLKPVQLADVKRLRGHVRHSGVIAAGQPDASCSKRKVPEGLPLQSAERRVRLNSVTAVT